MTYNPRISDPADRAPWDRRPWDEDVSQPGEYCVACGAPNLSGGHVDPPDGWCCDGCYEEEVIFPVEVSDGL